MRIAVLGCGSIGRRHIRCLRELGHSDLVLFDPSEGAREVVSRQFGLSCSSEEEDVWLERPDVVLITSPAPEHIRLARRAADCGCHLFIEKPLSDSLEGVDELASVVEAAGLISMVGCNMRFHPGPAEIHRSIHAGSIGRLLSARLASGSYLPNWRPWQDYRQSISARRELGGGVLLEGIHEIDLSLWLFGPGRLIGAAVERADSLGIEVEGLAEMLVRHDSGALSSIHLNFVQRNYRRIYEVIGTEGTLFWDFAYPWVQLRREGDGVEQIPLDSEWQIDQMYRDELSEFFVCVRSGRRTASTIADGRRALAIALDARGFDRLSRART